MPLPLSSGVANIAPIEAPRYASFSVPNVRGAHMDPNVMDKNLVFSTQKDFFINMFTWLSWVIYFDPFTYKIFFVFFRIKLFKKLNFRFTVKKHLLTLPNSEVYNQITKLLRQKSIILKQVFFSLKRQFLIFMVSYKLL